MDKKLDFNKKNIEFLNYFSQKGNIDEIVNILSENFDVYLFSGVIRDFFLKYPNDFRDIDFVVKSNGKHTLSDVISKLDLISYKQNSFGGFKLNYRGKTIDLWEIENTWALKENKSLNQDLFSISNLLRTPFFNFSDIVFGFRETSFYSSKPFEEFLKTKTLDLVFEKNPLPQLCVVNTIYYKQKFNLNISARLKKYFVNNFFKYGSDDYNEIQLKHFGKIKFEYDYLKVYNRIFCEQLML